jgi:hypothetical protein
MARDDDRVALAANCGAIRPFTVRRKGLAAPGFHVHPPLSDAWLASSTSVQFTTEDVDRIDFIDFLDLASYERTT